MPRKRTLEEVRVEFSERGYILLEDVYVNSKTPMRYKCPRHPDKELKICLNSLTSGAGCIYCAGRSRYTIEDVREEFKKRGYELLSRSYVNNKTPLEYRCPNHPDKRLTINLNNLLYGYGCSYCKAERQTGSGNPNWRGGVSDFNDYLREKLKDWKLRSLESFGFVCAVTGTNNRDLHVHHTQPFHEVRDEALRNLGLPFRENISDYSQEELDAIVDEIIERHQTVVGVPLRKDVHELFHRVYGFKTTFEDLVEFKQRYLAGELSVAS